MQEDAEHTLLKKLVFESRPADFEAHALRVFQFQFLHNELYRKFCTALNTDPFLVTKINDIPFLPISFFKSKKIKTGNLASEKIFESSGTTGSVNSKHYVCDLGIYRRSFLDTFTMFYGPVKDVCILGLLPSYLERNNASLVFMVNELIATSGHPSSGFYLNDRRALFQKLTENEKLSVKTIVIGVSFALLDFAAEFQVQLKNTIIMETGGMKGRRQEITRQELHDGIKSRLGINEVHSEYGMTELLSQAYAARDGIFHCPPWMQVLAREQDDPLAVHSPDNLVSESFTGVANIIDLANIFSCAFIATDDLTRIHRDGSFEILGRLDNSDTRGCGLMLVN